MSRFLLATHPDEAVWKFLEAPVFGPVSARIRFCHLIVVREVVFIDLDKFCVTSADDS